MTEVSIVPHPEDVERLHRAGPSNIDAVPSERPEGASADEPLAAGPRAAKRSTSLAARGEPYVWLTGGGLAIAVAMIAALLLLVVISGAVTFWPKRIVRLELKDGRTIVGEITRDETYRLGRNALAELDPVARAAIERDGGVGHRRLIRTGNYDLYGEDFVWVSKHEIAREFAPQDAWMFERREWGPAIGFPEALVQNGRREPGSALGESFERAHAAASARFRKVRSIERNEIGDINHRIEEQRLAVRKAALEYGDESTEHRAAAANAARVEESLQTEYAGLQETIGRIRAKDEGARIVVRDAGGRLIAARPSDPESPMLLSQIVRAYPANALDLPARLKIYLSRWWEFLTSEPREANTEGGVFPAIFGTFMMTVIMSLAVAPFGVVAALYLREYATQGPLVSAVRIAVNNLAGVPSIVFGVFGLGFFCYLIGARIDTLFFAEKLPAPTFGTGGILWASLTLALLTVPVVIVATEEALAAVPRSMREGSFACGASRWQTIHRVVLPRATPGILTGLILAMARGAGEVAPLMITGVVKLAPELPFDGHFPYVHLERSFMHLGFHIYDVGFQSRNSEAGKPMVFTTTLLLIGLVAVLNLAAVRLRSRLKKRYKSAEF
ncbi:MAG: phosphate ABC transporter permease PstA [Thermoanaerobaculia bacterium]